MSATPRPWTTKRCDLSTMAIKDACANIVTYLRGALHEDTAKMIVHRVNCHEQLVDALNSHAESCAHQKGFYHCQECVNEGTLCGTPVALETAKEK